MTGFDIIEILKGPSGILFLLGIGLWLFGWGILDKSTRMIGAAAGVFLAFILTPVMERFCFSMGFHGFTGGFLIGIMFLVGALIGAFALVKIRKFCVFVLGFCFGLLLMTWITAGSSQMTALSKPGILNLVQSTTVLNLIVAFVIGLIFLLSERFLFKCLTAGVGAMIITVIIGRPILFFPLLVIGTLVQIGLFRFYLRRGAEEE